MAYFTGVSRRIINEVMPKLPADYQLSVMKAIRTLEHGDPKSNGSIKIEGVPNGYAIKPADKNVEILYVVDDTMHHIFIFGVYIIG